METTDTQTRDIILRLKRVKAARGLSCGRICAMVAEAGGSVSLSTVKRVFADGSEDWSFRVCDTVQPIADVLLAEGGAPEVGSCERAAYQAITEQQRELLGDMSAMMQDSSGDVLSLAREQLAQYERRLRSAERRLLVLVVVITLLFVAIIAALVVDRFNPDVGFFWLGGQMAARHAGADTAIPGLAEIQAARDDVDKWRSEFERSFADVGGLGVRPRPQYDFDALYAKYPRAAAYLKADGMALAAHDVKAAAGRKARERIINGEDGSEALADAEAEWAAYCAEHIWD